MIPEEVRKVLENQGYRIVGNHSAVKICHWTKKAIRGEDICYKKKFYGIETHRCVQMTPAVHICNLRCVFCWRANELYNSKHLHNIKWDDPEFIVEESIKAQRELISGFGGNPMVKKEIFEEAWNPKHFAVSLAGEPTLYPYLSDLFHEIHKRKMTSFLVTNGTNPKLLENLDELPTQLYVSLVAWDEKSFEKITKGVSGFWRNFKETLEILPSLDTRKVIRITAVKHLNMRNPEKYAELIKIANPHFLEVKGYVHVGWSQARLTRAHMPSHEDIVKFGKELEKLTDYRIIDEKKNSRVILMVKEDLPWRKISLA